MSPQLISSFRRQSPPMTPDASQIDHNFVLSTEDARALVMYNSTIMTYDSEDIEMGPIDTDTRNSRSLDSPFVDATLLDDDELPPSTQPRPANWGTLPFPEIRSGTPDSEWSMEQYICFVYRGTSVSILRFNMCSRHLPSRVCSIGYALESSWRSSAYEDIPVHASQLSSPIGSIYRTFGTFV